MRVGEIKNIIKKVLDANNNIVLENEPVFGGQAYNINNFNFLSEALDILSEQLWNDADSVIINGLKTKYGITDHIQIESEEFNQLSSYIATLNQKVPIYYAALEAIAGEQDEKIINIKLPSKINSFAKLNDLNSRLEKLFKCFQTDKEFEFYGFDSGSDWYCVLVTGLLTYQHFISCLQIAQEILKVKTEYFKSEEAKLNYETSLRKDEKYSDKGLADFNEKRMKLLVNREVRKVVEEMKEKNGETEESMHTKLVVATTCLITELVKGTEFHLSLNPPEYAKEIAGSLVIDYKNMPKLEKNDDIKQLGSSIETTTIDA
jgi:hypothetical protein